jgi:hypothetical protein
MLQVSRRAQGKSRFEVLMVVNIQIIVCWVVTLCSLVGGYQHFTGNTVAPSSRLK